MRPPFLVLLGGWAYYPGEFYVVSFFIKCTYKMVLFKRWILITGVHCMICLDMSNKVDTSF